MRASHVSISLAIVLFTACGAAAPHRGTTAARLAAPDAQRRVFGEIFGEARDDLELEHEVEGESEEWEVVTTTVMEVELDGAAAVRKVEFEIPLALVPVAVVEGARARFPGATITKAEAVIEGTLLTWEIEARGAAGEEIEAYFSSDGLIIADGPRPPDPGDAPSD